MTTKKQQQFALATDYMDEVIYQIVELDRLRTNVPAILACIDIYKENRKSFRHRASIILEHLEEYPDEHMTREEKALKKILEKEL